MTKSFKIDNSWRQEMSVVLQDIYDECDDAKSSLAKLREEVDKAERCVKAAMDKIERVFYLLDEVKEATDDE